MCVVIRGVGAHGDLLIFRSFFFSHRPFLLLLLSIVLVRFPRLWARLLGMLGAPLGEIRSIARALCLLGGI